MTVRFEGRQVDAVALWSEYVEFPANFTDDGKSEFSPLMTCPNPKHQTTKRHFQINLQKPLVHCFAGCGISGSYEDAISLIEGSTHRQARKKILRHSRIGIGASKVRKKNEPKVISAESLEYDRYIPQAPMEYLTGRGITEASIAKFELGWDADSMRIVIPAHDERRRVKLLIRRTIKPGVEPRYLYGEGSERLRVLFGACFIDPRMIRSHGIVLVEGSIDSMILQQYGIPAVAILGSKVGEIQAHKIASMRPKTVYTMFDADAAGIGATISAAQRIKGIPLRVCRYPKGKSDPAVLTQEEADRAISRALIFNQWHRKTGVTLPKPRRRKEITQVG
jgi:DNA primase